VNDYLWWHDGIIYQIYPRSFADSNADGLGDLPGITAHLDYLTSLGVDALWLSPFYPSPDADFGYDVSDHTAVDPRFGTLEEFDTLVAEAHKRGLKIILDLVLNHTSDRHAWFVESRSSRENPKRNWYIWRDPRSGDRPPNNWISVFGGSTWDYDRTTGQYYLHLFTKEQPDVNWRNPDVRKAQLDVVRFWLARDVDGFRLDVFNAYFKHPDLCDNPYKPGLMPFDWQRHAYDIDQPEMVPLLQELRSILDAYPERYAVGETYAATLEKLLLYCGADRLHAAFSFDFSSPGGVFPHWRVPWLRERLKHREAVLSGTGIWPTTVLSNHDISRAATRYCNGEDDSRAKLAMALLLTSRGTPFMYYGEEIGMRDIRLKRGDIMDPPGRYFWPFYKGRDGCRGPMQWDASMHAGFSSAKPWLPVHSDFRRRNVEAQAADPDSLLNFTRQLIAVRKGNPALRCGDLILPETQPHEALVFWRKTSEQTVLVALNFSDREVPLDIFSESNSNLSLLFSNRRKSIPDLLLAPYEICIAVGNLR
jgi:alpha-glucosidase